MSTALIGCNAPQPFATKTIDTVLNEERAAQTHADVEGLHTDGVLTVGLRNSSMVPLVMELQSGDVLGLEVEIACAMADELGLPVTFTRVVDARDALENTCDIVMDVSSASDGYEVFGDMAESAVALFHKGPQAVDTVDQIKGKAIALQDGSSSQVLLRTMDLQVTEVPCETLDQAFKQLEQGSVDYVLCNVTSGAYLTKRFGDISLAGTLNDPVSTGIAVADDKDSIRSAMEAAFDTLKEKGILDETRRRWLGDLPHLSDDTKVADLPTYSTEGESIDFLYQAESVGSGAMDGSRAGANAGTVASVGGSAQTTQTTQTTQTPTYTTYDSYEDYGNYGNYGTTETYNTTTESYGGDDASDGYSESSSVPQTEYLEDSGASTTDDWGM